MLGQLGFLVSIYVFKTVPQFDNENQLMDWLYGQVLILIIGLIICFLNNRKHANADYYQSPIERLEIEER
jgi:hypothetical protein